MMKASVFYDIGDFRYEDLQVPKINDDEVLIKMKACGVCGTDVHKAVAKTVKTPIVLGHEVSGDIVDVGKNVTDFKIGDRIFVAHHVPCFTCHYCLHGHHTLCRQFKTTNIDPGGFSEYIRIPALNVKHSMHKIPDDMTYEEAAMAEPVACCIHGQKYVKIMPEDTVLIMGAGQIGIIHGQLAKARGAGKVFISDISDFRLQKALEFGMDFAINVAKEDLAEKIKELTGGLGVDLVIISAGISNLLTQAVEVVRRGGSIIVFSPFDRNPVINIDASRFFEDEISIIGTYSSTPFEYIEALKMIYDKKVKAKEMITHVFSLKDLGKAINLASNPNEKYLKVMIREDQ